MKNRKLSISTILAAAAPFLSLHVEGEPSAAPGGGSTEPTPATVKAKPKAAKKPAPKGKTVAKKAAKPAKKAKAKKASKSISESTAALSEAAKEYQKPKGVKTAGGNQVIDNGDKVAKQLRGVKLDEVYKIAARTLKEAESALRAKYKHLNEGMQRMNLGNRIRAAQ